MKIWSGCFLLRSYPLGRKVLHYGKPPLSLTPVDDTQVTKNIKSETKRCREESNCGCYWLHKDRLHCSWWMEKSLRPLWVALNPVCNLRVQTAITPCADSRSTGKTAKQELGWAAGRAQQSSRHTLGAFSKKLSAGRWCIAMDGRDAKTGQGKWELVWISHSTSWATLLRWEVHLQIKPQSRESLNIWFANTK